MTEAPPFQVEIRGHGVSALACCAVADRVGIPYDHRRPATETGPQGPRPIVLNSVSLALLGDLFPSIDPATLGYPVTGRIVAWGGERPTRIVEEQRVIDAADLIGRLRDALAPLDDRPASSDPPVWSIRAEPDPATPRLGDRHMLTVEADVVGDPLGECLVESVPGGWLFAAPRDERRLLLQAMVPSELYATDDGLDRLLRSSNLVAPRCRVRSGSIATPAAPAIAPAMRGSGWIHVGSGFAALDPISGEGTPFALRSALLLLAALSAVADGRLDVESALGHVGDRVRMTFAAHLRGCRDLYSSAFGDRPVWHDELIVARRAAEIYAVAERPLDLELRGFDLVPATTERHASEPGADRG